ncbi:MarR family transcriptional regulator [Maricaulis sp.]|uniref:MarR family transcriptional regulator n=1 Tax=Maricaulis sp. TaxID=1486257 RepID=UPI00262FBAD2|nr:MarR family transcriptional regulator [Maricaulis sp.]
MADDFVDELGMAVLPHHVRRMLDCFKANEAEAEPSPSRTDEAPRAPGRAGSTMRLLAEHGPLGVVEIANRLRLSHPLIINFTRTLTERGLVEAQISPNDRRVRLLALTEAGRAEARRIEALHKETEQVYRALCDEVGVDLLQVSRAVQQALKNKPVGQRLAELQAEKEYSNG